MTTPDMRLIRRLADQLTADPNTVPPTHTVWGVVVALNAGPPRTLNVKLSGSSSTVSGARFAAGYGAGTAPAINDVVYGRMYGTDLIIEDKLAT